MRDALFHHGIQAIASAPQVDGRAVLSADDVRELMGTVCINVIYEQILEAVPENNSADVLRIINRLLDAGNGPQQLARQFVRYLRNCLKLSPKITKLSAEIDATGIAADLLPDFSPKSANVLHARLRCLRKKTSHASSPLWACARSDDPSDSVRSSASILS